MAQFDKSLIPIKTPEMLLWHLMWSARSGALGSCTPNGTNQGVFVQLNVEAPISAFKNNAQCHV